MARSLWFVRLLKKTFSQRFFYARLSKLPVLGSMMDHLLFEGDDIIYLPKNRAIAVNEDVPPPGNAVLPSAVVDHFIETASYHWVMNECICRAATNCKDYPHDLGCLFLGEAAIGIHPELGRRVTKQEAREHIQRCQQAGLTHLVGRNKLDTIWLGVGPGNKLLTICNCCPCCCLWRILPYLTDRISGKVTRMPGVTVTVSDRCTGCGICQDGVCFVDAIHLVEGRAVHTQACRGCGHCATVCPSSAIEIAYENDSIVQDSIERLSRLVDLS